MVKTRGWPRLVEGLLLRLPAEESVWLVEQRAAVMTKSGARRLCLVKNKIKIIINDPGTRRIDRRLRKIPSMGLVVWMELLLLRCNGKWCHRMLLNHQLDGGKSAVFMSKG